MAVIHRLELKSGKYTSVHSCEFPGVESEKGLRQLYGEMSGARLVCVPGAVKGMKVFEVENGNRISVTVGVVLASIRKPKTKVPKASKK
jgi:hypothetical protein